MKLKTLLFIVSTTIIYTIHAQDTAVIRALYVDQFFEADSSVIILGDSVAEQQLFDYAQNCGYNYFILYGLSAVPLGNNTEAVDALRSFVRRAHENYDIKLACIGQSSKFFDRIYRKYQSLEDVDSVERLDSYHLEFEFWKSYHSGVYTGYYCDTFLEPNGYSCDSIGAFSFAMDELDKIDSIAQLSSDPTIYKHPTAVSTEIYIGWINEYHAEVLLEKVAENKLDRILGATYKPALEDGSLNLYHFFHQEERLQFLGEQNIHFDYLPIFAVKEDEGNHLGDWMDSIGSIPYVWEHYKGAFLTDTSSYTHSINLKGYVWYNYSQMPLCFDSLDGSGSLIGPQGILVKDSVYSFMLDGTENANRFYWELPSGAHWADSFKWNREANLQFSSDFIEGDTIKVRAANRCHLGARQYYIVQDFNALKTVNAAEAKISYQEAMLYITLAEAPTEKLVYQIYNLQGQIESGGEIKRGQKRTRISFGGRNTGWYLLKLQAGQATLSQLFFVE